MSDTITATKGTAQKAESAGSAVIRLLLEGRAFFALILIVAVFSLLSPNYFTLSN